MAENSSNDLMDRCSFLMDWPISLVRAMAPSNKFSMEAFNSQHDVLEAEPGCNDGEHEFDASDMIRVAVAIHKERGELIRMLMETIRVLSSPSGETLQRLEELERELSDAVELGALQNVRPKLALCLEEIRREIPQRQAANGPVQPLIPPAMPGHNHRPAEEPIIHNLDPVTGLPERHEAEAALERALKSRRPISPAVIVIDSLPAINTRFGRETGDVLLRAFGDHAVKALSPEDELFRWTGPAFVAVLRRPLRDLRGPSEFARLMEQKFEHTVSTASRDIHLSPAKRWTVLGTNFKPAELFREIDRFVSPAFGHL
jgi:GGDEF domain-containing protein